MALSLFLRSTSKFQPCTSNAAQILLKRHTPCAALINLQRFSELPNQNNQRTPILSLKKHVGNIHVTNPYLSSRMKEFVISSRQYSSGTDHGKLWAIEKFLSVALIGIIPATFAYPNALFDNLFAITTVLHLHWGIEATVIDYVRACIFGPLIPKLALLLTYVLSATILAGLLYINFNDIGIGRLVQKFWFMTPKGASGHSGDPNALPKCKP